MLFIVGGAGIVAADMVRVKLKPRAANALALNTRTLNTITTQSNILSMLLSRRPSG